MLAKQYGWAREPFGVAPEPREIYMNAALDGICSKLLTAVTQASGPALVLGEAGIGKTTLLQKLRWYLRPNPTTFVVAAAETTINEVLRQVCETLDVTLTAETKRAEAVHLLADKSAALLQTGKFAPILIDDGEKLGAETLLALHQLAELRTGERRLFPVVIAARPEFEAVLADPRLVALRRGFAVRATLPRLPVEEVGAFIAHQIRSAGGATEPRFAPDAIELAAMQSNGNPQILNIVCAHALTSAALEGSKTVARAHVELAIRQCAPRASAEVRVLRRDAGLVVEAAKLASGLRIALGGSPASVLFEDDVLATAGTVPLDPGVAATSELPLLATKNRPPMQPAAEPVPMPAPAKAAVAPKPPEDRRSARRARRYAALAAALATAAVVPSQLDRLPAGVAAPFAAAADKVADAWRSGVSWSAARFAGLPERGSAAELAPNAPAEAVAPAPAIETPPASVAAAPPPPVAAPSPQPEPVVASVVAPSPLLPPASVEPVVAAPSPAPPVPVVAVVPAPAAVPVAAAAATPVPVAVPVPVAPAPAVSAIASTALLSRGDQMLRTGDVAAARLFYERAAEQGFGPAATALAKTYDPLILREQAIGGAKGERETALRWYRKAAELGDRAAQPRLDALLRTRNADSR